MIIGIVAFIGALIPFLNYVAWFLGLIGLVLGVIGLLQKKKRKGTAIAGTVISAVSILLSIILAVAYTASFAAAVKNEMDKQEAAAAQPVEVVYDVTGTSADATVTYSTFNDGQSKLEQASNQALPWTKSVTVKKGGVFDYSSFTLTGSNGQDGGDVACKITVGGKVVSEQQASGAYATVTCNSTGTDGK
nr:MmpS family transport accessory protein [Leifsonia soli]